eukprot:TRINITY_DN3221_c0_g1_i14.p1 TRINITY_DN3221_c0_g1~~TRINITY_DN3221_c0_g1_i14.p1  ORF type:complete len:481 (-),score=55.91 TRINITY_DN3221_c0_g1_i14:880-2322(-)
MNPSTSQQQSPKQVDNSLIPWLYKCSQFGTIMSDPVVLLECGSLYDKNSIQHLNLTLQQQMNSTFLDLPDLKQVIRRYVSRASIPSTASSSAAAAITTRKKSKTASNKEQFYDDSNMNFDQLTKKLTQVLKEVQHQNELAQKAQKEIFDLKHVISSAINNFQMATQQLMEIGEKFGKLGVGCDAIKTYQLFQDFHSGGNIFFKVYKTCLGILENLKDKRVYFDQMFDELIEKENIMITFRQKMLQGLSDKGANPPDQAFTNYTEKFILPKNLKQEDLDYLLQELEIYQKQQEEQQKLQEGQASSQQEQVKNQSLQEKQQHQKQQVKKTVQEQFQEILQEQYQKQQQEQVSYFQEQLQEQLQQLQLQQSYLQYQKQQQQLQEEQQQQFFEFLQQKQQEEAQEKKEYEELRQLYQLFLQYKEQQQQQQHQQYQSADTAQQFLQFLQQQQQQNQHKQLSYEQQGKSQNFSNLESVKHIYGDEF